MIPELELNRVVRCPLSYDSHNSTRSKVIPLFLSLDYPGTHTPFDPKQLQKYPYRLTMKVLYDAANGPEDMQ